MRQYTIAVSSKASVGVGDQPVGSLERIASQCVCIYRKFVWQRNEDQSPGVTSERDGAPPLEFN